MKSQLLPTNPALGFSTAIIIATVALLPGSCDAQSGSDSEMSSGSGGYNSYAYASSGTCTGISGCALIDSLSECMSASTQVGKPSPRGWVVSNPIMPPGCFGWVQSSGYWALYFNTNMNSTDTCSQSRICLCKCTSGAAANFTTPTPPVYTTPPLPEDSGCESALTRVALFLAAALALLHSL